MMWHKLVWVVYTRFWVTLLTSKLGTSSIDVTNWYQRVRSQDGG